MGGPQPAGSEPIMARSGSARSATTPGGVVAVGASAGGVEALSRFAAGLPRDLPYAVMVVLHMPAGMPSMLARIIDRSGPLPAEPARDGANLEAGKIHVARPDHHLLVHGHRMVVSDGPTENGHRPAINTLFRSVALEFNQHAIAVLLSGVLDDGVLGLAAVRNQGGVTIAQEPLDAMFPTMPLSAVRAGVVDHQIPAGEIGGLCKRLIGREFEERRVVPDAHVALENQIAMGRRLSIALEADALGPRSGYTCPDCNGVLMAVGDKSFRCPSGHGWTADALLRTRAVQTTGPWGHVVPDG
jgi:two-component system, chemotaxis family, protein-glutamate methylesterase/glutaminase